MGSREEQSVIPGQHLAHFLLQGCFCCLLPEEAGHSAHSVLGEHLRGSLEQDLTLLPLKPALSCSRAGLSLTGSPRHFQSVIPVTAARAGEAPQECPGASSARAHLSSPGSCWSRRQAVLGSPPGSSASGTPCHAAQHTPAGGGHSGLFWRPLGAPQDWDNLGNLGLSEGGAWHPRPQFRARQTLKLLLHPPPIRGLPRNEESLNSLLQTLLRLVIHLELSEQQTPRVGQSCPPPRSARLSPAVPL